MRLTLKQSDHPLPHAHVHVRLGGLEVVVQVLAEAGQQRHSLLLPPPVHVLREDNFFFTFPQKTHTQKGGTKPRAPSSISVSASLSVSFFVSFSVSGSVSVSVSFSVLVSVSESESDSVFRFRPRFRKKRDSGDGRRRREGGG